jgi:cystathionine gamma-synthase
VIATSWAEGTYNQKPSLRKLTFTSLVLNPNGQDYEALKRTWTHDYEDNHWAEDSIFLERNSRDYVSRIERINANAEAICDVLRAHPHGTHCLLYDYASPTDCLYSEAGILSQVQ